MPAGVVLVPRTIIPVPEAREYMVKVEQKEASDNQAEREASRYTALWNAVTERVRDLRIVVEGRAFAAERSFRGSYLFLSYYRTIHYEFIARHRAKCLDVSIHFESTDEAVNDRAIGLLAPIEKQITAGVPETFLMGNFGDGTARSKWREARFRIKTDDPASPKNAARAAELMKLLIERTYPTFKKHCPELIEKHR